MEDVNNNNNNKQDINKLANVRNFAQVLKINHHNAWKKYKKE